MIENVSHFILGMIFGLSVYLFIRITIVSKKLDRLIRDINDIKIGLERFQLIFAILINNGKLKEIEIEIDWIILKIELVNLLVILMILLERKLMTSLLPSSTGGRHGA